MACLAVIIVQVFKLFCDHHVADADERIQRSANKGAPIGILSTVFIPRTQVEK